MKKYVISIIATILLSICIFSMTYETQALGLSYIGDPDEYIQEQGDNTRIIPLGNIVVGVVRAVGTAIALLMLTIIGIKYIMGSVQEKAEYKQTMWPYIIGAILIFAGSSLVDVIYRVFQNLS